MCLCVWQHPSSTCLGVSVGETIRVSHNLQEDVHLVEDGREDLVLPIRIHNLTIREER